MQRTIATFFFITFTTSSLAAHPPAAPHGPYFLLGPGIVLLAYSGLISTNISRTDIDAFTHSYSISYAHENDFNYTARAAFGYLFQNFITPLQSFGLECGYNYFGRVNTQANNRLYVPLVDVYHHVTTNEKTDVWSTTLEGVYARQFSAIPRTNIIVKLGIGYESMVNHLQNIVADVSNQLPEFEKIKNQGIGITASIGLQYILTPHFALRLEANALKGKKEIAYAEGLASLVWNIS